MPIAWLWLGLICSMRLTPCMPGRRVPAARIHRRPRRGCNAAHRHTLWLLLPVVQMLRTMGTRLCACFMTHHWAAELMLVNLETGAPADPPDAWWHRVLRCASPSSDVVSLRMCMGTCNMHGGGVAHMGARTTHGGGFVQRARAQHAVHGTRRYPAWRMRAAAWRRLLEHPCMLLAATAH